MKSIIFIALLNFVFFNLYGQADSLKLKKGIYYSFADFKNNEPRQIHFGIETINKDISDEFYYLLPDNIYAFYLYKLNNGNARKFKNAIQVWGFSDGEKAYIRSRYRKLTPRFTELYNVGRYCYFLDYRPAQMNPSGGGRGEAYLEFVLDSKTGKRFKLTKSSLKKILEEDPELYNIYKEDKEKKNKKFYYLKLFCERHK